MPRNPFELNIRLLANENPARYVIGMTMVGCLKHDQVVWTPAAKEWRCPLCGFEPREDAPPLVVKSVDHRTGTITVG